MPARRRSAPGAHRLVLVTVLGCGLVIFVVWLGLAYDRRPRPLLASDVAIGACFVGAGIAAWRLRPRSRIGVLMLALGIDMLLATPYGFSFRAGAPAVTVIDVLGEPLYWLQFALAGHLFLSYPTGSLRWTSPEARLVAACYALVGVTTVAGAAVRGFRGAASRPAEQLNILVMSAWIGFALMAALLLARRFHRSPARRRRQEILPLAAAGSAVLLFVAVFVTTLAIAGGSGDHSTAVVLHTWMAWTGVIAVPVAFLLGLLRERLAFAAVGDLVRRLESVGPDAVESALAQTLDDPSLRVAFPTDEGGLVDLAGQPFEPSEDARSAHLPLGDPPHAVLIHDPALSHDLELLRAAVAAAALALDNARLYALVRAQLAEAMASRQRIARTADAERQRLERDLHDGAQQRLLGIGFMLGALRTRLQASADQEMVADLEAELRAAIGELRAFAQGIRPAVLTDQGLAPALASLTRQTGVGVDLHISTRYRLDPIVEATAYYVVREALQNVERHAHDARATVSVSHRRGRLTIEVADDGPGGATMDNGTGLRSLADRVGAVGGQVQIASPVGGGTRVVAELPCT